VNDVGDARDGRSPRPPTRSGSGHRRGGARVLLRRGLRPLAAVFGAALLALALVALHRELRDYHLHDIRRALAATPWWQIGWAVALAAASYGLLVGYDVLALRHIRHRLPLGRTAATSFASNVTSHNLGLSGLGGAAVRFRLYTAWGLSAAEIAEVVAFCGLTFWLGFVTLASVVFVAAPLEMPAAVDAIFATTRPLGLVLLALAGAFFAWALALRRPLRVKGWSFDPPAGRLLLLQVPLAALDWIACAGALYVLLPAGAPLSFERVLAAFLLAQALGMVSHVPAGLGVFDTAIVLLLGDRVGTPELVAALLVYRVVYYLLPLVLGMGVLATLEVRLHRAGLRAVRDRMAPLGAAFVPRALAASTFASGAILLWTGTQPALGERLSWMRDFFPLPVVELSHFSGSTIGAGLLILARGLQRQLRAAWWITAVLLVAGMVSALGRGLDWEEATACAIALALLLPSRSAFFRRASLLGDALRVEWFLSLSLVLLGAVWLGLLAFRHVDYRTELWWHFSWRGDASRFLRATAGAASLVVLTGVARLLRPADVRPALPSAAALERVGAILATTAETVGHLALVGDKSLLFHADGTAFVMYGVARSTWVAMGDPVGGTAEARRALIWEFREAAERAGDRAAFYEVAEEGLGLYAEAGFGLLKLGEEARVDLSRFGVEGHVHKSLRSNLRRAEREQVSFEVLPPENVAPALAELRAVSDAWLAEKDAREKHFSLGSFRPEYLVRGPMAVVRSQGRIVAFANLWRGAPGGELSLDLMRHAPQAPPGTMDFLFVRSMEWGRDRGYRWFSLGMAPLAGVERRPGAPIWNQVAALVYGHGERFYNFRGLRAYKNKFDPVWRSRYLATPRGLALPAVLRDVAGLISGAGAASGSRPGEGPPNGG